MAHAVVSGFFFLIFLKPKILYAPSAFATSTFLNRQPQKVTFLHQISDLNPYFQFVCGIFPFSPEFPLFSLGVSTSLSSLWTLMMDVVLNEAHLFQRVGNRGAALPLRLQTGGLLRAGCPRAERLFWAEGAPPSQNFRIPVETGELIPIGPYWVKKVFLWLCQMVHDCFVKIRIVSFASWKRKKTHC